MAAEKRPDENTKHITGEIVIAKANPASSQPRHPTPTLDMDGGLRAPDGARGGTTPLMPDKANLE